ncbi:hypothetical protein QE152_g29180 [Popillia japonica]|uniref:Uncharacterized protein n=1 Tax=Popillia japonica TaxID=7064 RepID=A0AAW1JIC6_POPJA
MVENECSSSEDENIDGKTICKDSSSGLEFSSDKDGNYTKVDINDKAYSVGDYISVKLKVEDKKDNFVHYIGKVLEVLHFEISFLKVKCLCKSVKGNEFYFPNQEDMDEISSDKIIGKLQRPKSKESIKRTSKYLQFKENLTMYENVH